MQNGQPEADVASEQQSIVMARVAPMLSLPDNAEMLKQLRALVRQSVDFGEKGLSEGVAEFCSCITVIVNHQVVESFTEFLEVLGEAVEVFSDEVLAEEESQLAEMCQAFLAFPKGLGLACREGKRSAGCG